MKIACYIGGFLFCLFTYWQLNDLDQYGTQWWQGWVLAYGLVAALSFTTAWRPLPVAIYAVGIAMALFRAVQLFGRIEWESRILYNENNPSGNETGGLIITALWLGFLWYSSRKLRSPGKPT